MSQGVPPGWYPAPDAPGERWWTGVGWGSHRRRPPWRKRHPVASAVGAVLAVLIIVGTVIGVLRVLEAKHLDAQRIDRQLQARLADRLHLIGLDGRGVRVICPDSEPVETGHIFDCVVTGYPVAGFHHVRVTEDDDQGHIHFEMY